ncbi:MAG: alpha/beta hydrolase [Acidimicrobiia bacterium]|nr:alpha/beta hydrolase [Acidimicrobiia bacterium]MCY4434298.1 alpha/beta hydrolase [bacterium]
MTDDFGPTRTTLTTDDGFELEAEQAVPSQPRARVVIAHPHPQHGGNMHSLVVSTLFNHLMGSDCAVLRFNFRGVGRSGGEHDFGEGEQLDVRAAVDAMASSGESQSPLVLAGWSFGADLALTCDAPELAGWFLVAPPLRVLGADRFKAASDSRPKWLAVPERDQFNPPDQAQSTIADWTNSEIHPIGGADHFLVGRTDKLNALVDTFLADLPN